MAPSHRPPPLRRAALSRRRHLHVTDSQRLRDRAPLDQPRRAARGGPARGRGRHRHRSAPAHCAQRRPIATGHHDARQHRGGETGSRRRARHLPGPAAFGGGASDRPRDRTRSQASRPRTAQAAARHLACRAAGCRAAGGLARQPPLRSAQCPIGASPPCAAGRFCITHG